MENGLKIFEREEFGAVRVHLDDRGEPWFVAKDVCSILEIQNVSDTLTKCLDDDEKGIETIYTPGGPQQVLTISESGLYSLIFRSRKPEAKAFSKWVRSEILPTIRKTGQYGGPAFPRLPKSFPEALRMLADIEEEKQLAIAQRDEAIRTKAEIGSRREATAMAAASAAKRKVRALADRLGEGERYKQVKAVAWLLNVFVDCKAMYSQVGKHLTRISKEMGIAVIQVPDAKYKDGVKAYHVDVVEAFRQALERDVNMLAKYRLAT